MDDDSGSWVAIALLVAVMGVIALVLVLVGTISDHNHHQRDFANYRQAVELCTSLADSGEELRRCMAETP